MKEKKDLDSLANQIADKLIERVIEIINDRMKNMPNFSAAIVESVNNDGTVNVYIPPDKTVIFTRISNQSCFELNVGDSVELLLRDGSYNNCWVVAKHGVSFASAETAPATTINTSDDSGTSPEPEPLSNYVTEEELANILNGYITKNSLLSYVTKTELKDTFIIE